MRGRTSAETKLDTTSNDDATDDTGAYTMKKTYVFIFIYTHASCKIYAHVMYLFITFITCFSLRVH